MEVGGAACNGFCQHGIDQSYHRLAIARASADAGLAATVALLDLAHDVVDRHRLTIVALDGALELGVGGKAQLDLDVGAELGLQAVKRDQVIDPGRGDDEVALGRTVLQRQ